jgi:DNA-binding NtrC family response regulator
LYFNTDFAKLPDMPGQKPVILAVDDEADMLETFRSILSKKYSILTASSGAEALELLIEKTAALALLDVKMPDMNGIEVLKKIKELEPGVEVIMVSASKDIISAVEAMKLGALDYITKPFEVKELLVVIEKALEKSALSKENLYLKETLKEAATYCELIGRTAVMKNLFTTIEKVAAANSTILINGESGTGKELVARAIHTKSKRASKPFVAVNCAAIPENLLESELFGHERGAFTGALERKLGKFELADGGTLFLDEIGCMSAPMQAKLLRVLENKMIERVGGEKTIPSDVRIISATNINFARAIEEGKFRHDLFYRLNVIPVNLVPLRERKEDIPLFVRYFLDKFNRELNKNVLNFTPEALQLLMDYRWPGNVRELQNLIERVVVLSAASTVSAEDLPLSLRDQSHLLKDSVKEQEKEMILKALKENGNNRTRAAKMLGIARSSLNSKISVLGIA